MRICIKPFITGKGFPQVGGVGQCIVNLKREYEKLGHKVVQNTQEADVTHGHAFDPSDDVYTSHGVYPEENDFDVTLNHSLFNNLIRAKRVTAVSKWTAEQFKWIGVDARVIHNGVDYESLQAERARSEEYIFWGKAAADYIRNPLAFIKLADKRPDLQFLMTLAPQDAPKTANLRVIGLMKYAECLRTLARASVYVSTGTENFSIQILEAMALGVPVLAVNKGGVDEVEGIVKVKEENLADGLEYCLKNRDKIIKRQLEVVRDNYTWDKIAKQYIEVFNESRALKPKKTSVSVVIPCYNYASSVGDAITSCLEQTEKPKEIIVVDDGSTDGIDAALKLFNGKIKVIKQKNSGVSEARNNGIRQASGDYIICLDADDKISKNFLKVGKSILDEKPGDAIAYPGMLVVNDEGKTHDLPATPYSMDELTKANFIPCANVFRKEAWRRAGGYKSINPSWEDYDMWLSMCEIGYTATPMLNERMIYHTHTRGRTGEAEGGNHAKILRATVDGYHPRLYRNNALVTVVIPCYNQWHYVRDAVKSAFGQTYPHVEVIVVDDASTKDDLIARLALMAEFPKVKIFQRSFNGGLSAARNTGIELASGGWILPLDADDKIHPEFLKECLKEVYNGDKYAYTDIFLWHNEGKGPEEIFRVPEYDCSRVYDEHLHACTILMKKSWVTAVGMYDANMRDGWEDLEFALRLAINGVTGKRIPEPMFYYRVRENSMRKAAEEKSVEINKYIWSKHKGLTREALMACCGNPVKSKVVDLPIPDEVEMSLNTPEGMELAKYNGGKSGQMSKRGSNGVIYRYGSQQRLFYVNKADLALFPSTNFSLVKRLVPISEADMMANMNGESDSTHFDNPVDAMPDGEDDFMLLDGMNAEFAQALKEAGLTTFKKIVASDTALLGRIVGRNGSKVKFAALAKVREMEGV